MTAHIPGDRLGASLARQIAAEVDVALAARRAAPADLLVAAVAVGAGNTYVGRVVGEHDGDTMTVAVVDPILSVPVTVGVRLAGINAPELSEPGGPEVRDALQALVPAGTVVYLSGLRPDEYRARVDANVRVGGVDIAGWLLARGYAVVWDGRGKRPRVPWPPVPPGSAAP